VVWLKGKTLLRGVKPKPNRVFQSQRKKKEEGGEKKANERTKKVGVGSPGFFDVLAYRPEGMDGDVVPVIVLVGPPGPGRRMAATMTAGVLRQSCGPDC